jgi:dihydropteroate synthase
MSVYADIDGLPVGDGSPVRVMGAVNLSPESFYRGSFVSSPEEAVSVARSMMEQGAEIIDVGAVSTAPYAGTSISESREREKVCSFVAAMKEIGGIRISVDTFRASVADAALRMGAVLVNDVTGLKGDSRMASVVKERGASVVVMAHDGRGDFSLSPVQRVIRALSGSIKIADKAGIERRKIVVDPGIGFFRERGRGAGFSRQTVMPWYEWDCTVIRNTAMVRALGRPVCVSPSRKSFIGEILGLEDPEERLAGSLGAASAAVLCGADIVRTHDVRETLHAVRVAEAISGRQQVGVRRHSRRT